MDTKNGVEDCSSRSANCAFVIFGSGSKSNGKNFTVNETIQVKSDFEAVVGDYKITSTGVSDGYPRSQYLKLTCPDRPVVVEPAPNLGCFDKLLPIKNAATSGSVTGKTSGAVWGNNGQWGGVYMDTQKGAQDCSSRSANCAFVTLGSGSKSNGKNFTVNETIQVKSDFAAVVGDYKVTGTGVYDGYTYLKLTCPDRPR
jgi:hypothetical protein